MNTVGVIAAGGRDVPEPRSDSIPCCGGAIAALAIVLLATCFQCEDAHSQVVDSTLWIATGSVVSSARSGNTLYLAGSLGEVGPATGGGVPVGAFGGAQLEPYPKVTGYVACSVPDGHGGWFIAGDFSAVGGVPRNSLAHILVDGRLADWSPRINDHHLGSIAYAHGTIYVCGSFDSIGGQPRHRLGAVDAMTGEVTAWDPNPSGTVLTYGDLGTHVLSLIVTGDTVFVGGGFAMMGGQPRGGVAAVDAPSGRVLSWDPGATDGYVYAMALWSDRLYLGGDFSSIGGATRRRVAAVDVKTAAVTPFDPDVTGQQSMYLDPPYVKTLAVGAGRLFIGGRIDTVGGAPRSALAAVDASTGALLDWSPDPIYDYPYPWPYVWSLALCGDRLFVGGSFDAIGGAPIANVAAVDVLTGTVLDWNPRPNSQVWSLGASDSVVYVGGSFRTMGPWRTPGDFAALDLTTGALKGWNPSSNGLLGQSVVVGDGVVYVGGDFTSIGGQARNRIAALDTLTGAATSWNPGSDARVRAMLLRGRSLYVGGDFRFIGGQPRRCAAALDTATGMATSWDPNPRDLVFALAGHDSTIYLGGFFETIGGQIRRGMAAVDDRTGALLPWAADADGPVYTLASGDSTVFAGGSFTTVAGQPRQCLAAMDARSGALRKWDPAIFGWGVANAQPEVHGLVVHGHTVYAGGDFYYIGGQARPCLAALDDSVGRATSWAPQANFTVLSLSQSESILYAGGVFGSMGLLPNCGLAALTIPEDPLAPPTTFAFERCFPNPAHSLTTVRFALPSAGQVTLTVFDIQGRRIARPLDHAWTLAGYHEIPVRADEWRPGLYLYALEAGGRAATWKVTVLR